MVTEAPERPTVATEDMFPLVYFAGPIDYVEHRNPGDHQRDNWRHRFFGDLPITMMCPTCLNSHPDGYTDDEIMERNRDALRSARFMVAYFPGDEATFGTPLEIKTYLDRAHLTDRQGSAILIHPAKPGVFVRWFVAQYGLIVHKSFMDARDELRHQLWRR